MLHILQPDNDSIIQGMGSALGNSVEFSHLLIFTGIFRPCRTL